MDLLREDEKNKLYGLILKLVDYEKFISGDDIYSSIAEHLNQQTNWVYEPVSSELEKMVEAGVLARYELNLPKNSTIRADVDRKMPKYYYKLVKTK